MVIFVDTSALYSLSCAEDRNYFQAIKIWEDLVKEETDLVTNNYIVVECISLFQNRFGIDEVRTFQTKLVPFLNMDWIGEEQHAAAIQTILTANRRNLSLVDCASFETMRRLGIETVFTFDEHFRDQGFKVIP
ncbi:MAG: PIN domain-containing protein [Chloroflexi bacterium]|jgi:predicted nucleic acid-binding protein|nr:PIN domain-containing protein [Chloroflexota bacterium]